MNISEFRAKNPEYNDMDDQTLAAALYKKSYSDMPKEEFDTKFLGATPTGDVSFSAGLKIPEALQQGVDPTENPEMRGELPDQRQDGMPGNSGPMAEQAQRALLKAIPGIGLLMPDDELGKLDNMEQRRRDAIPDLPEDQKTPWINPSTAARIGAETPVYGAIMAGAAAKNIGTLGQRAWNFGKKAALPSAGMGALSGASAAPEGKRIEQGIREGVIGGLVPYGVSAGAKAVGGTAKLLGKALMSFKNLPGVKDSAERIAQKQRELGRPVDVKDLSPEDVSDMSDNTLVAIFEEMGLTPEMITKNMKRFRGEGHIFADDLSMVGPEMTGATTNQTRGAIEPLKQQIDARAAKAEEQVVKGIPDALGTRQKAAEGLGREIAESDARVQAAHFTPEVMEKAPVNQDEIYRFLGRSKRLQKLVDKARTSIKELTGKDPDFTENIGLLDAAEDGTKDAVHVITFDHTQKIAGLLDDVSKAARKNGMSAADNEARKLRDQWYGLIEKGDETGAFTKGRAIWAKNRELERLYDEGMSDFFNMDKTAVGDKLAKIAKYAESNDIPEQELVDAYKKGVVRTLTGSRKGEGLLQNILGGFPQGKAQLKALFGENAEQEIERLMSRKARQNEVNQTLISSLKGGTKKSVMGMIEGAFNEGLPIIGNARFYSTMGGLFATGSSLMDAIQNKALPKPVIKEIQSRLTSGSTPEEVARMFEAVFDRRAKRSAQWVAEQSRKATNVGQGTGLIHAITGEDNNR
jgi:hypothetical protein